MRVHQPAALELLRAAGAEVSGDDLVRLPARLVERARATAPAVCRSSTATASRPCAWAAGAATSAPAPTS
jgi:trimethylamine:corrinoid methyltransferase-like protein